MQERALRRTALCCRTTPAMPGGPRTGCVPAGAVTSICSVTVRVGTLLSPVCEASEFRKAASTEGTATACLGHNDRLGSQTPGTESTGSPQEKETPRLPGAV